MFEGISYVGIGVSNMERSLEFYRHMLGFKEVVFDYTGVLPGIERVTAESETRARVVMLKSEHTGPLGLGMIELVCLSHPRKADPCPIGLNRIFGDIAILETCINTSLSMEKISARLSEKRIKFLLGPGTGSFPPYDAVANYAYIKDPDGGLIEFINWAGCQIPGEKGRIEGVNHVAIGVSDIESTAKFYHRLGFTELIMDYTGPIDTHASLYPSRLSPDFRIQMLANYRGATLEPLQLLPPHNPTPYRVPWGHLGPMEFAVRVSNIEQAYQELSQQGITFMSLPHSVDVSSGEWKYVYLAEPNNLHVSLVEPRF
jgi:catechol 2,3-dioxygenase-like lactoylglutathione lyase family enzyme